MPVYSTGNYRIPYDIDGTEAWIWDGASGYTAVSQATLAGLNKEQATGSLTIPAGSYLLFIAPRVGSQPYPHAIFGFNLFTATVTASAFDIEYSYNSTTGADGAWSTLFTNRPTKLDTLASDPSTIGVYDQSFTSVNTNGAQASAIRMLFHVTKTITAFHLFGQHQVGYGLPALVMRRDDLPSIWDIQSVDAADVQRGLTVDLLAPSNSTHGLVLFSQSFTQTANGISLFFEAPSSGSSSGLSEHELKIGSGSWGSTGSITSIGPNSGSSIIRVRRNIAGNASLGRHMWRLRWSITSWT